MSGMPVDPLGPTRPWASTGDGLANAAWSSQTGTLHAMKVSVPESLPRWALPSHWGSFAEVTGWTQAVSGVAGWMPPLGNQPVGRRAVRVVLGESPGVVPGSNRRTCGASPVPSQAMKRSISVGIQPDHNEAGPSRDGRRRSQAHTEAKTVVDAGACRAGIVGDQQRAMTGIPHEVPLRLRPRNVGDRIVGARGPAEHRRPTQSSVQAGGGGPGDGGRQPQQGNTEDPRSLASPR
jgi:hypothetical protein